MTIFDEAFKGWLNSRKKFDGFPAKGTLAGALVVLEALKSHADLSIDRFTAEGGSQVIGASGPKTAEILARFNETRPFVAEGGRTNRGLRGDVSALLNTLKEQGFAGLSEGDRTLVCEQLQSQVVTTIQAWHDRKRLSFEFEDAMTTRQVVTAILDLARHRGIHGAVAQHLVGAKLALRFPEIQISNYSASTADQGQKRAGDFEVGDTAFHVTMAPFPAVFEKCGDNVRAGLQAYLLVPFASLASARLQIDSSYPRGVTVEAIESFIGGNIDEIAVFGEKARLRSLIELFDVYNQRVEQAEIDKSLLIEIPIKMFRAHRRP